MFREVSEVFFLECIDIADSCRLNMALSSRLSTALYSALDHAAYYSADAAFSDAALEATLCARFLAVITMHIANWADSNLSFSGDGAHGDESHRDNILYRDVAAIRASTCSKMWQSLMDLRDILEGGFATGHAPALVAAVMVSDVALRAAAADPIAPCTAWFVNAVDLIRGVARVRLDDADFAYFQPCGILVRCAMADLIATLPCALDGNSLLPCECSGGNSEAAKRAPCKTRNPHPAASTALPEFKFRGQSRCDTRGTQSVGEFQLEQACVPGLEGFRYRMSQEISLNTSGLGSRRLTPHTTNMPHVLLSADTVRVQNDASGRRAESTMDLPVCFRDDLAPVRTIMGQDVVQRNLWQELCRTLDTRVVDLASLIAADPKTGVQRRRNLMFQISELLLPEVPAAPTRVAAWCYIGASEERPDLPRAVSGIRSRDQGEETGDESARLSERIGQRRFPETGNSRAKRRENISHLMRLARGPNDTGSDLAGIAHVFQEMGLQSSAG
jgi:hypothetical protein